MAGAHAGQAGHDVPAWLYNLPSNLSVLNERQMLPIAFLDHVISSAFHGAWTQGLAQQAAGILSASLYTL